MTKRRGLDPDMAAFFERIDEMGKPQVIRERKDPPLIREGEEPQPASERPTPRAVGERTPPPGPVIPGGQLPTPRRSKPEAHEQSAPQVDPDTVEFFRLYMRLSPRDRKELLWLARIKLELSK